MAMSPVVLNVSQDFYKLGDTLTAFERREFPFAAALALTRTAKQAQVDEKRAMQRAFKTPRPYTLNSAKIEPATKRKLEASVFLADRASRGVPAGRYLRAEIEGGNRTDKGSERKSKRQGIFAENNYLLPGPGADLDAFGDMRQGQLKRVLASFASGKGSAGQFFLIKSRTKTRLPAGIYRRRKNAVPILVYALTKQPTYERHFDFYGAAMTSFRRNAPLELGYAMERALRAARG